jgi:two-component system phosphate regulon sensor histidine kinase PhoR
MENISSAIIESMSDGLIVLDFHGHITRMNPAASELLGIKMQEIKNKTYSQLFMNEPDNDAFNDLLLDGIQNGETRLYGEVRFMRRDGCCLDLGVTTSFLRTEPADEEKAGIVVVFKNITEFKALDRARRRVLDHLSHELKTPLSIILTSLKRLESSENDRLLERIRRNLERLQDIQGEVEDIVKQGTFEETHDKLPWLEQTLDFVQLLEEEEPVHTEALRFLRTRIEDFFSISKSKLLDVRMGKHIQKVVDSARELSSHRSVTILTRLKGDYRTMIDPDVLEKTLMSLLKNAIENTPDGGELVISLWHQPGSIVLEIKDSGVGITEESQKHIFGGFYHSLETDLYSTKKPFDFGAGGKGLDLLRIKIFGDIYHFQVECESTRCQYIPRENDSCPGVIAKCLHVHRKKQCAQSGGTVFKIIFPEALYV